MKLYVENTSTFRVFRHKKGVFAWNKIFEHLIIKYFEQVTVTVYISSRLHCFRFVVRGVSQHLKPITSIRLLQRSYLIFSKTSKFLGFIIHIFNSILNNKYCRTYLCKGTYKNISSIYLNREWFFETNQSSLLVEEGFKK